MSDLKSVLLVANCLIEKEEKETAWLQADFSGKRILLVEDNELNREIAEEILEETGFVVETAPDGSDAATDAISVVYAESSNGEMELFGREAMLNEYTDLKAQKKAVDERIKEIENTIKDDMQEIPLGRVGRFSVVWKSQQRSVFQLEEFKKDHPGLDLRPYIKTTTSRPFKVTENKED